MTETATESPHRDAALGDSALAASGENGVMAAAFRKPWKTPTVITSAMSAAGLGADIYEDGAIGTNYNS